MAPYEIPFAYAQTAKKIDAAMAQLDEIIDEFYVYLDNQDLTVNEFKLLRLAATAALDAREAIILTHSKYTKGFLITFAYEGTGEDKERRNEK